MREGYCTALGDGRETWVVDGGWVVVRGWCLLREWAEWCADGAWVACTVL